MARMASASPGLAAAKARLDHVYPQAFQLAGDTDFFFFGHRSARRLLAITQGGIENDETVAHVW